MIVHVHVRLHIYTHTHTHIYIYIYMNISIYIYIYIYFKKNNETVVFLKEFIALYYWYIELVIYVLGLCYLR